MIGKLIIGLMKKGIFMKNLLIVLLAFGSISAFAKDVCVDMNGSFHSESKSIAKKLAQALDLTECPSNISGAISTGGPGTLTFYRSFFNIDKEIINIAVNYEFDEKCEFVQGRTVEIK